MDTLAFTISIALVSVSLRALCGVIDRHSLGIRGAPIIAVNALNNFVPFGAAAAWLCVDGRGDALRSVLGDPALALFGVTVQVVAFAFSYGFKTFPVSTVNIAARMGDVLIPVALVCVGVAVSLNDFLFAAGISVCVLFAYPDGSARPAGLWRLGVLVTTAVVVQSIVAELAFQSTGKQSIASFEGAAALLFWRGIFCIPFFALCAKDNWLFLKSQCRAFGANKEGFIYIVRAVATVLHHSAFFYVLAHGNRVVAWPILNAVPLFSAVFASLFLREKMMRREFVAIAAFTVLAALKTAFN